MKVNSVADCICRDISAVTSNQRRCKLSEVRRLSLNSITCDQFCHTSQMLSLSFVTSSCSSFTVKSKQLLPASLCFVNFIVLHNGTDVWFYVLFWKGCAQTCRHGAVLRRKGGRVDSPVASTLWTLGLTSTGTVRSDPQTVAILHLSHHTCKSESVTSVGERMVGHLTMLQCSSFLSFL